MGLCTSVKKVDAEIVIVHRGNKKVVKKRTISLAKLISKVCKLSNESSNVLLSLSSSGNPVFIHDEGTWDSLKITKKDLIVIMPAPEHALERFELTQTGIPKLDEAYWVIEKNIKDFLEIVDTFNENLDNFIRGMSYMVVRSHSFQQFIVMFMVLMRPYTGKVTKTAPFVVVKENVTPEERGKTPEPGQLVMPKKLFDIMTSWQLLMGNVKDVEFQLNVVSNNLEVLLEERKKSKLIINKGKVVNLLALTRIENNLRIFYGNEEVKRISEGFENFVECISNSVDLYSDERQRVVTMLERINIAGKAKDIDEVSCQFAMADYALIPSEYRFT